MFVTFEINLDTFLKFLFYEFLYFICPCAFLLAESQVNHFDDPQNIHLFFSQGMTCFSNFFTINWNTCRVQFEFLVVGFQ